MCASGKSRELEGQSCLLAGEAIPLFQHLQAGEFMSLPILCASSTTAAFNWVFSPSTV